MKNKIPEEYLREAASIPEFWLTQTDAVIDFIHKNVKSGEYKIIGNSAGGRPIYAVYYGTPRKLEESTTFNASLAAKSPASFIGSDLSKKVYMAIAGVHGSELEGIMGIVNLISVFETSRDLAGREQPELLNLKSRMDRLILVPIVNMDGRSRIPLSMFPFYGENNSIYQFWGTGGWDAGKNIGYPDCKKLIPLDFSKTLFPGGYPNDNGVNIQHDDFFSDKRQAETQHILDLARREKPNLIYNLHTGVPVNNFLPFIFCPLTGKTGSITADKFIEKNSIKLLSGILSNEELNNITPHNPTADFNLNSAIYYHSSSIVFTMESPCHALSGKVNGIEKSYSPEELLKIQLNAHEGAMKFILSEQSTNRENK